MGGRQPTASRRGRDSLQLEDGAQVAVIGGGPAGALSAYFLLRFAALAGRRLNVDIYEPRDFDQVGPRGCNMCGGLVAGPLVELLAAEGIAIPARVVQNQIDGYSLFTDAGHFRVVAPSRRQPALAVYRGGGPRDGASEGRGFDAFLLSLATGLGATLVRHRVATVTWHGGRPEIGVGGEAVRRYDLVVVAIGVNLAPGRLLEDLGLPLARPRTARAYVTELGSLEPASGEVTGSAMGIVLPRVSGVDAVGVIPKGGFSTLCILGTSVDRSTTKETLAHSLLRPYRPWGTALAEGSCHCSPSLNVRETPRPFADRVVLVGDCGVTRLYKDGLGSAFRTARAAAWTAVHRGVSERDLRSGYGPLYREIARDNRFGIVVFALLNRLQASPRLLRASLRVVAAEQRSTGRRAANGILWDVFTGGAPYRSILRRSGDPRLALRVGAHLLRLRGRRGAVPGAREVGTMEEALRD
jgi:flavin-dependent dehydrogenase